MSRPVLFHGCLVKPYSIDAPSVKTYRRKGLAWLYKSFPRPEVVVFDAEVDYALQIKGLMVTPFLIAAAVAGVIAGTSAFLITYDEYSHHFPDKKRAAKAAAQTAGVAFIIFAVMVLIASIAVMKIIQ